MTFKRLTEAEQIELELHHRHEGDGRVRDRIKAVLLRNEGWEIKLIAQALRIQEETVRQHLKDWTSDNKVKPANGGSRSNLNDNQSRELEHHLEQTLYVRVIDICDYVNRLYQVLYTVSGMTKWLHSKGFSYKQPTLVPSKADASKQAAFIEAYKALKARVSNSEPIVFIDSVHPTMATKLGYGWIRRGTNKVLRQTASRTRVNITGAIELSTMKVVTQQTLTVNAETTCAFLGKLKEAYATASKLHIILDGSGYHRSEAVRDAAVKNDIELHFLPPYSPNLNPIERLWKVMNEQVRNNVFFPSAQAFREAITHFFEYDVHKLAPNLKNRINDNFQLAYNPVHSG